MTDTERLEYLAGQVHALLAFANAVVRSHPEKAALRAEFERSKQIALAMTESKMVSEEFLAGQRETNESLSAFFL